MKRLVLLVMLTCLVVTQVEAQSQKDEIKLKADVTTMSGEEIKDATLTCGPFGWDSYIQKAHYSRNLESLAGGTAPERTISFRNIARMDFLEMTEAEWKTLGTSQFRETILKAKVTFRDGNVWSPVYIVSHCSVETPYEEANFNKLKPKQIVFKHSKK
jgi:hypothetical protein